MERAVFSDVPADIVTDALTAFGMKAGEAGHFADVLAVASSNANTEVAAATCSTCDNPPKLLLRLFTTSANDFMEPSVFVRLIPYLSM